MSRLVTKFAIHEPLLVLTYVKLEVFLNLTGVWASNFSISLMFHDWNVWGLVKLQLQVCILLNPTFDAYFSICFKRFSFSWILDPTFFNVSRSLHPRKWILHLISLFFSFVCFERFSVHLLHVVVLFFQSILLSMATL